jgi:A/G-specific adenine glycosylase
VSNWAAPRARLLAWYDAHARDLPWRRTRDPYAIWVSEIMLQQTRVETVIPYYERFLARFPSAHALADAPLDDVLAHWSGLGYYRRARLLHEGARAVASEHAGQVPREAHLRRALPGVGRYTAGAIGSIAFDLPEPIVDGNVARVLARVLALEAPLGTRDAERALWQAAAEWAEGERPGALNQALMELGARVCLPQRPRCAECPLAEHCQARADGRAESLPVVPPKKPPKPVNLVALAAFDDAGRVWLQRGEENLFGGLWSLPSVEGSTRASVVELAPTTALEGVLSRRAVGELKHVLTHRVLSVRVYVQRAASGVRSAALKPVALSEIGRLGTATLTRKLLALAGGGS